MLKRFIDLSNFQQWALFYIITHGKINVDIKSEINNFCDKTKNDIDLDRYDDNMAKLQDELLYFQKEDLLISPPNSIFFILSTKGELFCFQNLNKNLDKINTASVLERMKLSNVYNDSKSLCDSIFLNHGNLKAISSILIGDPKDTMSKIQIFVEIIRALSGFSS